MSASKTPLILIADDDPNIVKALQFHLESWGCRVASAANKEQVYRAIDREPPAVLLLDVRFGEHDGVELLQGLTRRDPECAVIMLTAYGTIDSAVSAMKLGATDYLTKPPDLNRLKFLVGEAIAKSGERRRPGETTSGNVGGSATGANQGQGHGQAASGEATPGPLLIGGGPATARLRELIAGVAPTDATVLILGESGTGKEVVARALHARSNRKGGPFVALNMAALPRELVESTLFGHEKGAFTGADQPQQGSVEAADKGTLFLDEIGEMEVNLQAKLLRFLQERTFQRVGSSKSRPVDVRIVAATNRDPLEQVRLGQLREDLYYRLNVVPIVLTPLRGRREDVPELAEHFLRRVASRYGKAFDGFTPEALDALARYDWPGNVRQLENMVERLAIFGTGPRIGLNAIPPEIMAASGMGAEMGMGTMARPIPTEPPAPFGPRPSVPPPQPSAQGEILRPIEQMEKQAIEEALRQCRGNVREAARSLGLGQATVYRKIKRYGINPG